MGKYSNPLDLYKAQQRYFNVMAENHFKGHENLAIQGLGDARRLTSGNLTPDQTKGAFARVGFIQGSSPANYAGRRRTLSKPTLKSRGLTTNPPLLPINRQSGQLMKSFKIRKVRSRYTQKIDLYQENPGGGIYTLTLGGTRKMVARGFFPEIKKRWKARNKAFLDYYAGGKPHGV